MAHANYTTFTCDCCGGEVVLDRSHARGSTTPRQPADWFALRLTRPPLSDPTSKDNIVLRADLCPLCADKVGGLVHGTLDVVEVEEDGGESEEDGDDGGE